MNSIFFENLSSLSINAYPHCEIKHSELGGKDFRVSLVTIQPHHNAEKITHQLSSELAFLLSGSMEATINEGKHIANPGDLIYIPKGHSHSFKCLSDSCEILVVHTPNVAFNTDHNLSK